MQHYLCSIIFWPHDEFLFVICFAIENNNVYFGTLIRIFFIYIFFELIKKYSRFDPTENFINSKNTFLFQCNACNFLFIRFLLYTLLLDKIYFSNNCLIYVFLTLFCLFRTWCFRLIECFIFFFFMLRDAETRVCIYFFDIYYFFKEK